MNLQVVSWMLQAHWSKSEVQLPSHLPFIKLHDITSEASTSRFWEHFQNLDALGIPYNSNHQQGCCIAVFVSQVAFVRKSRIYMSCKGVAGNTITQLRIVGSQFAMLGSFAHVGQPDHHLQHPKKKRHRIEEATVSRL